jgi:hypothetical protein
MKNILFDENDMVVYKGIVLDISCINLFNWFKRGEKIENILKEEYNIKLSNRRNDILNSILTNFYFR